MKVDSFKQNVLAVWPRVNARLLAIYGCVEDWAKRHSRVFWVVAAGFFGLFIFLLALAGFQVCPWLPEWTTKPFVNFHAALTEDGGSSGAWSALMALTAAPVAFAIWVFRNQDKHADIENTKVSNQHKARELHLKDFQQLTEWAADTERAIDLRVVAVYQLREYLKGNEASSEPAFVLLLSLWRTLVSEHLENIPKLKEIAHTPLAIAITNALASDGGITFRKHKQHLPGACLAGMDFHLPGLPMVTDLSYLNLNGIQLQGAKLGYANLQGARLWRSNFREANLRYTQLQSAYLLAAYLQKVNLGNANLQEAELNLAQLQGAHLYNTKLQGTYLIDTNLKEVQLIDILFDQKTNFIGNRVDSVWASILSFSGIIFIHALRLKLRWQNKLRLHKSAYQEYRQAWLATPKAKRHKAWEIVGTKTHYTENDLN